jgi:sugar lactone lactonase YvrE
VSRLRYLVGERGLVESPRWHDGRLWFADWTNGEILAVTPEGESEVVVRHASLPLCFDRLPDGRAVLVSNSEHALLAVEADGSLSRYADVAQLSAQGCNDIVVDGRGNAYVNSPNFDFQSGPPDSAVAPGFVALVRPDGSASVVADDISFPNGMAVTADNATLVVADSYRHCLVGFDIDADGGLSNRQVWADLGPGTPDGICLDAEDACWYADVPNQWVRRVRAGGEVLDTVDLDGLGGFACMLGGDDGRTLFVVAAEWHGMESMTGAKPFNGRLLATDVEVAGAGWPARV